MMPFHDVDLKKRVIFKKKGHHAANLLLSAICGLLSKKKNGHHATPEKAAPQKNTRITQR